MTAGLTLGARRHAAHGARRRLSRRGSGRCAIARSRTSASFPARRCNIAEHMAAALSPDISASRATSTAAGACASATARGWSCRRDATISTRSRSSWSTSRRPVARAYGGDRITEIAAVLVRDGVATTVFDTLDQSRAPDPAGDHGAHEHHVGTWCSRAPRSPRCAINCSACSRGTCSSRTTRASTGASSRWRSSASTRRPLVGRVALHGAHGAQARAALRRRNLDAVAAHYGIENYARHRAGGDAVATAQVLASPARRGARSRLRDARRRSSRFSPPARRGGKRRKRRPSALPHSASDDTTA